MKNNYKLMTRHGYELLTIASGLQKATRRADTDLSGFCALELFHSGYYNYLWKRLLTISAEDCYGIITKEIYYLYESFLLINKGRKQFDKGRIFISKAILLLCEARKNRDADHLQNVVYDRNYMDKTRLDALLKEAAVDIPDYVYDVHTKEGRSKGKTKKDFFREEQEALNPKQPGLYDNLAYKY